ncbi:NAD(P)H-dependent oxidoreductase [Crocinitomix catalasitica]|uniref:NAD(P)H-dependent oxidoreductase n=1 Tax=Crocinitomix catalasitica TaxID=184607 RepID=UPI0004877E32|nr:NAD(P)H-dependent oxidoreductase [Crocinitomix catalasitica]
MENKIISSLRQRYATQSFDSTKILTEQQVASIIEAVRLTPTSYGLQLMKVVVVENKEKRKALVGASYGQKQVDEASHLFIICREVKISEALINAYVQNISKTRQIELDQLIGYRDMMVRSILTMPIEQQNHWMEKQVYIALGNLLNVTALLDLDACPMEGFSVDQYIEILDLKSLNLVPIIAVPIGHRHQDDSRSKDKKVRRSISDFMIQID